MALVAVKFVKAYAPYKEGDIAGFNEADVKIYLDTGVAEIIKPATKAVDKPKVDKQIKAAPKKK